MVNKVDKLKLDVQGMREKILDLAMRGKLVSQDKNDEPASVLLEKIAHEKEQLIKEKKIKKTKPLPEITDEEKPFDIPDSWEWVRLGEVTYFKGTGIVVPTSQQSQYPLKNHVPYFKMNNIGNWNGKFDLNNIVYVKKVSDINKYVITEGELLFNTRNSRELVGKSTVVPNIGSEVIAANNNILRIRSIGKLNLRFINYYLISPYMKKCFLNATSATTNVAAIYQKQLLKFIIPLPPLNEQKRIAAKVEELFELLDIIEESTNNYENLQKELKEKILELGMQGKLVEQNTGDEPASELYEQIQAEKAQLIKEKKIKKTKPLPEISDEEKPFDIPDSWKWVRLGEVINLLSGRDIPKKEHLNTPSKNSIPYITGASNILGNEKIEVTEWIKNPQTVAKRGTLLISVKGTIGKLAVLNLPEAHIARQIMGIENIFSLDKDFQKFFIESYVEQLKKKSKSMIPGISRDDIILASFPLPPLNEQKRIATKIEELFNTIDN